MSYEKRITAIRAARGTFNRPHNPRCGISGVSHRRRRRQSQAACAQESAWGAGRMVRPDNPPERRHAAARAVREMAVGVEEEVIFAGTAENNRITEKREIKCAEIAA